MRAGNAEIDLLTVRCEDGRTEAKHVEVNVSTNPVGYLTDLTPVLARARGIQTGSARRRESEDVRACVQAWIGKKFEAPARVALREAVWPGLKWDRILVHGRIRFQEERAAFVTSGIILVPIRKVLDDLCGGNLATFSTSAAGDLVRLIEFLRQVPD
jgi:hypothetical protein